MIPSPTQVVVALTLMGAIVFAWAYTGRGRWYDIASERLLYGVPWGTGVTVAIVVAFYLFAQDGISDPTNPIVLPFVSWSYFYPFGVITSGIAHGSAAHIMGNMTTTLALAPIAEYFWGHYPGGADRDDADPGDAETGDADTGAAADEEWMDDELLPDDTGTTRLRNRPWVRAVVIFPAALLGAALLTGIFSMGPSLGFSGAVFAIAGFALMRYPLSTLVAALGSAALGVAIEAVTNPVVQGAVESSPPSPPSWAGIAFQAHGLGFLIGVVAGLLLLATRDSWPKADRVFFGTLLFGMVFSLWLIALPTGADAYTLYRGVGVVIVVLLTILITLAVGGNNEPVPAPLGEFDVVPSRETLAYIWLAFVAVDVVIFAGGAIAVGAALAVPALLILFAVMALPAVPVLLPESVVESPIGRRHVAILAILGLALLVALPGAFYGMLVVGDDPVPGEQSLEVRDYTLAYAENTTSASELAFIDSDQANGTEYSGVFLVSEQRQIWTMGVRKSVLEYSGNETISLGGVGWRETVEVERTGWNVAGNESVYTVDLHHDGETTRSFTSNASTSEVRIEGHAVTVVPTQDSVDLRVSRDGAHVGTVAVPEVGESTAVGDIVIRTELDGDARHVYATTDGSRALIVAEETYQN